MPKAGFWTSLSLASDVRRTRSAAPKLRRRGRQGEYGGEPKHAQPPDVPKIIADQCEHRRGHDQSEDKAVVGWIALSACDTARDEENQADPQQYPRQAEIEPKLKCRIVGMERKQLPTGLAKLVPAWHPSRAVDAPAQNRSFVDPLRHELPDRE